MKFKESRSQEPRSKEEIQKKNLKSSHNSDRFEIFYLEFFGF